MILQLEKLFQKEHEGLLGEAIVQTSELLLKSAPDSEAVEFLTLNLRRLFAKVRRQSECLDWSADPIHEHAVNPREFAIHGPVEELPPLVTLTTISERLPSCLEVVRSLACSPTKFHSINLYISSEPFLIDKGIKAHNPYLNQIHEAGANVYMVKNSGPYRKMVPLIHQLRTNAAPAGTKILTVDDDVQYPENAWDVMLENGSTGDKVITHRGRRITSLDGRIAPYSAFTLPDNNSSFADLPNGRNGVLYRLGHFPEGIEYFVGSVIAPTADDLWAKCVTLIRGVPVSVLEPSAMDDPRIDYPEMFPQLKAGLFHAFNAKAGNDLAFKALEAYFSDLIDTPIASLIDNDRVTDGKLG